MTQPGKMCWSMFDVYWEYVSYRLEDEKSQLVCSCFESVCGVSLFVVVQCIKVWSQSRGLLDLLFWVWLTIAWSDAERWFDALYMHWEAWRIIQTRCQLYNGEPSCGLAMCVNYVAVIKQLCNLCDFLHLSKRSVASVLFCLSIFLIWSMCHVCDVLQNCLFLVHVVTSSVEKLLYIHVGLEADKQNKRKWPQNQIGWFSFTSELLKYCM